MRVSKLLTVIEPHVRVLVQADVFFKGVTVFANLEPQWNETMGCYTLNFYDRVKLASKKNYQMIRPGDKNTIFFQFGKVRQKKQKI